MTTLENAASVLKLFRRFGVTQGHPGLTFTEIVDALRLPKSTVSRLLSVMESEGLLERDSDSRCFHPGALLLSISGSYLAAPLVDRVTPVMLKLAERTGCMGYISVLSGRESVILRMFHGGQFTQVMTPPGSRIPAASSSGGRMLLAQLNDDEVRERYSNEWHPGTPSSPQSCDDLCLRLAEVRKSGFSLACNETVFGISSLAVSISNQQFGDSMALCLSFLSQPEPPGYPQALLEALQTTAADLMAKYGADRNEL